MIAKKNLFIFLLGLVAISPAFAQKFTKKDNAKQEARAKNYFHGSSFTFTAGYVHSWMSDGDIHTTSATEFGRSESFKNNHDAFNIGFLWDHSFSKRWGMQNGLYYVQKGGDKFTYHDNGLGTGPLPRASEEITLHGAEWQCLGRYFFPITHESRLSLNAGGYVTNIWSHHSDGIRKWDVGLMCGIGYDYRHVAVSVSYQPGVYHKVSDNSDLRLNSIMLNVGFRFWKK